METQSNNQNLDQQEDSNDNDPAFSCIRMMNKVCLIYV